MARRRPTKTSMQPYWSPFGSEMHASLAANRRRLDAGLVRTGCVRAGADEHLGYSGESPSVGRGADTDRFTVFLGRSNCLSRRGCIPSRAFSLPRVLMKVVILAGG